MPKEDEGELVVCQGGAQLKKPDVTGEIADASVQVGHTQYPAHSPNPSCDGGIYAKCASMSCDIPERAKITGITRSVREAGGNWIHSDVPWNDIGWCDWIGQPNVSFEAGKQHISQGFKNWSADRTREARIVVEFIR